MPSLGMLILREGNTAWNRLRRFLLCRNDKFVRKLCGKNFDKQFRQTYKNQKTTLIRWFSIFIKLLQRNIPMLPIRSYTHFIFEHTKGFYQFSSGILRKNHLINKTTLCCCIWIRKQIGVFCFFF